MFDVPEQRLEPPDEPEVFIECYICRDNFNAEDRTSVNDKYICIECRNFIANSNKKKLVTICDFCGDAPDYKTQAHWDYGIDDLYLCKSCKEKIDAGKPG